MHFESVVEHEHSISLDNSSLIHLDSLPKLAVVVVVISNFTFANISYTNTQSELRLGEICSRARKGKRVIRGRWWW